MQPVVISVRKRVIVDQGVVNLVVAGLMNIFLIIHVNGWSGTLCERN